MINEIRLYDKNSIETLEWPDTDFGRQMKGFLLPLIKEGVEKYVSNVKTRFCVLAIDDFLLPLTINDKEYLNSYVASNYYPVAGMEEWFAKSHPALLTLKKPVVWTFGMFLKWVKINRVVMVNNWLFSTNLYPSLSQSQISRIGDFLKTTFPDHVHIFRGINTLLGDDIFHGLKKKAFTMIGIRQVYIYDPKNKGHLSPKVQYHHRRDYRLLEMHGYEILQKKDLSENDFPRLLELYKQVYLDKYTSYSPSYTIHFLKNALENQVIDIIGVKKEGKIDGIMGLRILNGIMSVPFFGYDTTIPQSVGLYRMMIILAIKEAENRNVILNDSSGASTPKKFRGLKPHAEFVAIYDRHLPINRRLFWTGAGIVVNKIVFPILKKFEKKADSKL